MSHHLSYCFTTFYLSCLSFAPPSPLSSQFLISFLSVTRDTIFHPQHFLYLLSVYLGLFRIPFFSQLFTPSISISFSMSPSFSLTHLPPTPLVSLSPSLPSQQPYCPWVGVNNVGPHGAPVQSQPRRQGAPENTHNSMFQLGCRIKGSLTHGWLCGSALDHLWRRRPATGTRIPHWECVYIYVDVSENECVMSPCNLMARPPSSSSQPRILWETSSSLHLSPPTTPILYAPATRCLCEHRGQNRGLFGATN